MLNSQAQDQSLMTRWGLAVTSENVHPEYPRPQLTRDDWLNLNGLWDYAIATRAETSIDHYDGSILVPFPVESSLSGVKRRLSFGQRLWYRRTFEIPSNWGGGRVLLHFGAVNWESTVWVNGVEVSTHRGGYDPFSVDITDALKESGAQEIVVVAWNPLDKAYQPRGKQVDVPQSIWYTPTTGIWQTVWLEPVPDAHISGLKMTPDIDTSRLHLNVNASEAGYTVKAEALRGGVVVGTVQGSTGETLEIAIANPALWSPDAPNLYDLKVTLLDASGAEIDHVGSYFGMRKIAIQKDSTGVNRIFLNDAPIFNFGPLDQGFWPDGLYTPPSDEALRYDIELTKELGYNTIRKHVKVESARWYYWADKLGVLVWQDMPSGDKSVGHGDGEITREPASVEQFELELRRMIDNLYNYPSIVIWVVFNEGWGQFDTVRMAEWTANYDPSRLINSASGWNDMEVGHFHDIHVYPGPDAPPTSATRAAVLGEFGGLGLATPGHMWQSDFWGYRAYDTGEALVQAYTDLIVALKPLKEERGLAAAIYTQTTDVETEANGLMTYDREVIKLSPEQIRDLNITMYESDAP